MKQTTAPTTTPAKTHGSQPFFGRPAQTSLSAEQTEPAFFGPAPFIQAKLTIGAPDDPYEREADAVAEQVVQRMSAADNDPAGTAEERMRKDKMIQEKPLAIQRMPMSVQRKCAACEEEEKVQKKEEEKPEELQGGIQRKPIFESNGDEESLPGVQPPGPMIQRKCAACEKEEQEAVQRKPAGGGEMTASPDVSSRLSASKGGGSPLPASVQSSMGGALGADLSGVRVHTDSRAVQLNRDLGAQAFTHGSDVYFGAGKFQPGTGEGDRLLAHELVHVGQQNPSILTLRRSITKPDQLSRRIERQCNQSGISTKIQTKEKETGDDLQDGVFERKYTFLETPSIELWKKKIKVNLKASLVRGKSIVDRSEPTKDGKKVGKFKMASTEFNPIMNKYALKIASASGEYETLPLGCKLNIKLGLDALKLSEKGINLATVSLAAYTRYDKADFDNPGDCEIIPLLKTNPSILLYIEAGWSVYIEFKAEVSLDAEEITKIKKLKNIHEEIKAIEKESDEVAKELEKHADDMARKEEEWMRRGSKKNRKLKKKGLKSWKKSNAYKKLNKKSNQIKKKAKDVAKKLFDKADEAAKLGSKMKSTFGKRLATQAVKLAKRISVQFLKKAIVVIAIIDATISIFKIIKYWDNIKFPWEEGGNMSLDDAPLFGDVPEPDKSQKTEGSAQDSESPSVGQGENTDGQSGGAKTTDDKASVDPTSGELANAGATTGNNGTHKGNSENADTQQVTDAKQVDDDKVDIPNSKSDENNQDLDTDGKNALIHDSESGSGQHVEPETETLTPVAWDIINKSPEPVKDLVIAMLMGKIGPSVTDSDVAEILRRIPITLNKEQSAQLQEMLSSQSTTSIEDLLKKLEEALKQIKGAEDISHVPDVDSPATPLSNENPANDGGKESSKRKDHLHSAETPETYNKEKGIKTEEKSMGSSDKTGDKDNNKESPKSVLSVVPNYNGEIPEKSEPVEVSRNLYFQKGVTFSDLKKGNVYQITMSVTRSDSSYLVSVPFSIIIKNLYKTDMIVSFSVVKSFTLDEAQAIYDKAHLFSGVFVKGN